MVLAAAPDGRVACRRAMPREPSVLVVSNPISGGGRAAQRAASIVDALAARGLTARSLDSQPGDARDWLAPQLRGADLIVVVGGDGAVRQAASVLAGGSRLLWHSPSGTENLVARSLGMRPGPDALLNAIDARRYARLDLGWARADVAAQCEHAFVLMASCGFDAEVVSELHGIRHGAISHLSYLAPILRVVRSFAPSRLRIDARGGAALSSTAQASEHEAVPSVEACGNAIVANGPRYALGIDPIPSARLDDGRLHAAIMACRGGASAVWWGLKCLAREGPAFLSAERFEVAADRPIHWQIDGDAAPWGPAARVEFRLQRRALPVLLPAPSAPGHFEQPWRNTLVWPAEDWTITPTDQEV